MDQGWKRLPLLVVFLFWRNADGLKSSAYSDAHRGWGQPSDARSHHAVQSSMSEVHVTGTLPVEEVGSSLFPAKPLKSKSKWNLPQFVKGGSSSYLSMSHAQAAPSSSVSLPLSRNQQSSSSLAFSGSTVPGVAGGLRLETQYAASGSGPVSTLRESSSYPAQLGVSGQSTSDALHVSSSQETQSAFSQSTSVLSSQKQYSAASQVSSGAHFGASTGLLPQRMSSSSSGSVQSPGTTSQFALGSYPNAVSVSLSSPQAGPSTVPGPQKQLTSTYTGSSGTQAGSSTPFTLHGSPAYGSRQPQGTTSLSAPGSPSSYAGLSHSSPQGVASQSSSQKRLTSIYQVSSGAQLGASTGLFPQRMSSSSSGSVQSPGTTSQFAFGSYPYAASVSLSSPQSGPSTVPGPQKQLTSTYTGSSGTQAGSSTPFTLHGSPAYGSRQPQGTTSLSAPGSPSSYAGLSQSSPQGVASQFSSQKRLTSIYQVSSGAQVGASTGLLPQRRSSSSSGSVQSPGTTGQFALGSYPYATSVSLSSLQAGPSTVPGPQKQLTSTYSGTQAGSSTPFTLHGSPAYGSRQPQGTTSLSAPGSPSSYAGLSHSSPQGVASQSSSQKRLTSIYQVSSGAQLGASTGSLPQRMSSSSSGSVQSPGTTSQFAFGSYPYAASVSLSSPQSGPSTVPGPQKQLTSTYTGSSGTQAGSSTPFTLHGSPAYGESSQLQDMSHFAASSPYGSLYCKCSLSPQGVDHPSTVQSSQKQFTSSYGTQSGSSPFTLQGSVTFDGSQPQGVASQSVHGSLKQLPSTFVGSSGTQAGSSTAILRGGTTYGGSSKP
ncbi:uncharacterized protein LOC132132342 [Carassius carassius]|uniref:uncharacterized protein LOC132132342 n=1 Tax=Carassius carassius TaxID=217509 RepID=UPI002868778E|nr:uncharacterized protein LOC132132342 [Carassius carassius]